VIIVIIVVAVVLVLGIGFFVARRRGRARVAIPAPARAAMPTVLVTELAERPSLEAPSLAQRIGSSRSVFDRVRSLSSVGH